MDTGKKITTIAEYYASLPKGQQAILQELQTFIQEIVPEAILKISYQMPTFYLNGNLVHFAAFSNHLGFYPAPEAIRFFAKELENYPTSKGAIRFPWDQPVPYELIKKIVIFRQQQNLSN